MFTQALMAAAALLTGCMAQTDTVDAALNAYRENRVAEAETILGRLVADPSTPAAVRAQALLGIARIAAHVDDDLPRALQVLGQARQLDDSRCDAAATIARLLNRAGRDAELLAQIDALAANCSDPAERAGLFLQAAEAALDHGAAAPGWEAALQRARALLNRAGEDARNGLQGSTLLLEIALLARDAPGALQAWRNYFWLRDTDNPQGIAPGDRSAADIFALGLAAGAGAEAKLHLLDLLIRAGFARPAERFAEATGLPGPAAGHPLWTRAAAYLDARRGLERELLAANRRLARGQPAGNVRSLYDGFIARLTAAAGGGGRDPTEVLRTAYGLYGLTGRTGGFPGIHLGHVVESRRQTVEQYGHRADVGFIVLDGMLANGFQSWLWEGFAATGGWTEAGPVIVQVRPEYTSSPLASWGVFSGGAARRRLVERQPQRAAADLAALAGRNVAPLGGLADRLRLQTIDQLGARARQLAGQGGDLRRAFLDEYRRASFQHSILLHEGRHAIDRTLVTGLARLNNTNLEYRAKLSELALADYPRMALYNIVDGGVGDGTGHGDANAMVLDHYRRWTEANRGQVAGFEPGLPALAQIDRLTDAQIRAVARGLDPIAN